MLGLVGVLAIRVLRTVMSGSFMGGTGGMMLMKLLGAVRTVEFMALAGNPEQGNSHQ